MSTFDYISDQGLKNLENYGYHGKDDSFLGNNVLCYWWDWLVLRMPLSLAPNLITFIGLMANVISYLLLIYYSPTMYEVYPAWVSVFVAISIFFYQSMDNIDGKQARRTKSSTPLGELFDHVCDALALIMFSTNGVSSLRGGHFGTMCSFVCISIQFYLTHWEEYFTGELLMGKWDGPTEGQMLAIFLHLLQAVAVATGNGGFWVYKIFGFPLVFWFLLGYAINTFFSVKRIFERSFKLMKEQGKSKEESLRVLAPFTIYIVCTVVWYFASINRFTNAEARMYFNCVGFIFGYLTSRLIVQRICKEKCVLWYPILIPLVFVTINDVLYHIGLNLISHTTGVWILFLYTIVNFFMFSYGVIQQLTKHLKINCFTIPTPPKEKK